MRPDWRHPKLPNILYNLANNICIDTELVLPKFDYNLSTYPDEYPIYLALSKLHNVIMDDIVIGYGLGELIQRIYTQLDIDSLSIVTPTWPMAEIFPRIYNIPITDSSDVLYLSNPNGIHGTVISVEEIKELLNQYKLVILDEAYGDYSNVSMITEYTKYDNLIILKTFSKTLSLPGLRLGYCISSNKDIIERLQLTRPSCVSSGFNIDLVPKLIDLIPEHLARMKQTKEVLVSNYNAKHTHGNFVLFDSKPNIKDQVLIKQIDNFYRMSLFNMPLMKEIFND